MSPGNDMKQPAMVNSIPIRLVESKQKVRSPWESPQEGTKGLKGSHSWTTTQKVGRQESRNAKKGREKATRNCVSLGQPLGMPLEYISAITCAYGDSRHFLQQETPASISSIQSKESRSLLVLSWSDWHSRLQQNSDVLIWRNCFSIIHLFL